MTLRELDPSDAEELDRFGRAMNALFMGRAEGSYGDRAAELAYEAEGAGSMDDADLRGSHADSCGDRLEIFLKVREGRIERAAYLCEGCGASTACGSALARMVRGLTLREAGLVDAAAVIEFVGGLPEADGHAAEDWVEALRDALGAAG
jgi:NifU-like protein involved in Fe-S cluster formation